MKLFAKVLLILGVGLLTFSGTKLVKREITEPVVGHQIRPYPRIPEIATLGSNFNFTSSTFAAQRTVVLESSNTVVFRGVVSTSSVTDIMRQLRSISRKLPSDATIYLVLDTPGGSVPDGYDLIDFMDALPQRVETVTLFAASMGFEIVQNNPGERLITQDGILMAHPAEVDGLGGQLDGQLESRYHGLKRQIDFLDYNSATRMGLTLFQYKSLVHNELWVNGFDAVNQKVADAEVTVRCGRTMDGIVTVDVATMLGNVSVDFEKCPLMKAPVAIHEDEVPAQNKEYIRQLISELFNNQGQFTRDYIVNNKYYKIFR